MDGIITYGSALVFGKCCWFMSFSHTSGTACSQEGSGQGFIWPFDQQVCGQTDVLPFVLLHFCATLEGGGWGHLEGLLVSSLASTLVHLHPCQFLEMLV